MKAANGPLIWPSGGSTLSLNPGGWKARTSSRILDRGHSQSGAESDSTCWLLIGGLGWGWLKSLDLRERVVGAVAAGQSCRSVAKTFMVSVASVVKWSQRQRAMGTPAALKMGGHRPYLVARERDWVLARIAEKPDLTLRALLARRRERWKARHEFITRVLEAIDNPKRCMRGARRCRSSGDVLRPSCQRKNVPAFWLTARTF